MKLKRILFSMMALFLTMTCLPSAVHAQEGTKATAGEIPSDMIWNDVNKNDLKDYYYNMSVYLYPIQVGTSADEQIGYIKIESEDRIYTTALVPLYGNMLEDFDTGTPGKKSFNLDIVDEETNGVYGTTLHAEIVEKSNMKNAGKPASIEAFVWGDSGKNMVEINGSYSTGQIRVLDDLGNPIYTVALNEKDLANFNPAKAGTQTFPISYIGLNTTMEIAVHNYKDAYILLPDVEHIEYEPRTYGIAWKAFEVQRGADLKNFEAYFVPCKVDENGKFYHSLVEPKQSRAAGFPTYDAEPFPSELIAKIDTSKAGVYNVSAILQDGRNVNATVNVGGSSQSTIEELLPKEAQETMPASKSDVLSVWDVPSGEAGAGTWVFATGLYKGSTVDVWTYHNQKWLEIGTYTVDQDGNITVTFTADQLSPVLLTKNTVVNPKDEETNVDKDDPKKDNDIVKKTGKENAITNSAVMFMTFVILGIAVTVCIAGSKTKKASE